MRIRSITIPLMILISGTILVACGATADPPTPTLVASPTKTAPTAEPTIPAVVPTAEPTPTTVTEKSAPAEAPSDAESADAETENATQNGTPNRLINEKSPYLLQHAYNPVDWHPWGPEAFEKARAENKPIFVSIGYSTCHWCHVMEEESFGNEEVAALMNETFVSIIVDREERPDIDSIYMNVSMMMTGSGGWPLNIIMTPEQKPFFAGTYIPRETRFQRVGMLEMIPRVQEAWKAERADIENFADQITAALQPEALSRLVEQELDETTLAATYQQLAAAFDPANGGFGTSPKFPSPHNLLFLLRHWQRTGEPMALEMVETTLQSMRRGGIYDQIGFGFHRYSTDAEWLLPHFEKMLYDQALLAMAYTETYQITRDPQYEAVAREIFTYILRDMTDENGGFYSAEDADSEGEEGLFYLWSVDEISELLAEEDADLLQALSQFSDEGNFLEQTTGQPMGLNIVHLSSTLADFASEAGLSDAELAQRLETIRQTLFDVREERIHPHKDDKILTDWNGLMIAAFAKAARTFDDAEYAQTAGHAADFLLETMRDDNGRLLHRYRDGETAFQATVDDYAFFVSGLLELYETTFDLRYLEAALALNGEQQEHFWDELGGGFYLTPDDGETLISRQKEIYDGAIPSGNSVTMLNLLRLGRLTGDVQYEEQAAALSRAFANQVSQGPMGHTQLMSALSFGVGPTFEVVIVGEPEAADTQAMVATLRSLYLPNKVVLLREPGENPPITELADYTKYHSALNDQATAYVCRNFVCEFPTNDAGKMLELLQKPAEDE